MTDNNNDNNFDNQPKNDAPNNDNNKNDSVLNDNVVPEQNAVNSTENNSAEETAKQSAEQNNAAQQPPSLYSWDGTKQAPVKKKKGLKIFAATVTICLLLTISLIIWSVSMGYMPLLGSNNDSSENASITDVSESVKGTNSVPEDIKIGQSIQYTSDLIKLYDKIDNSCISVVTDVALGSGFIISEDGYIVTNHHVISAAKDIKVVFYDGTEYPAKLIGSDAISDIAVLKIEGSKFNPMDLGNSDLLQVGEEVVAVGTPYSLELAGTMNLGIISGIARDIKITNDTGATVKTMTLIQTDTSINPGNSGGPLINMAGQVVGINTMKLMSEYEGLGFAIPIKNAISIARTLIEFGVVDERPADDFVTASPKLNVTVMTVKDAVTENRITANIDLPSGAFVIEVTRNSSIYMSGLELYDIITEFNGVTIDSKEALIAELLKCKAGDTVSIKVFRLNRAGDNGQYYDLSFVLESAPLA